jgi:hypothetical protein
MVPQFNDGGPESVSIFHHLEQIAPLLVVDGSDGEVVDENSHHLHKGARLFSAVLSLRPTAHPKREGGRCVCRRSAHASSLGVNLDRYQGSL